MRYKKIEFDKLQQYFGEPYTINIDGVPGEITIQSPTIGDIIVLGESKFYQTLNIFTTNTTVYRSMLWDMGIDWNDFSDFNLFCLLYKGINNDASKLIFGDNLVFDKFELYTKKIEVPVEKTEEEKKKDEIKSRQDYINNKLAMLQNHIYGIETEKEIKEEEKEPEIKYETKEVVILYDVENDIEINEEVYQHITQYLRSVFNMNPEEELTSDNMLKKWWVDKDKRVAEREKLKEKQGKKESYSIQPLISFCVNHPGFKYNLQELRNVGVAQFYDSVKRLQIYENAGACLRGMYGGFVDGSKISPDSYNFFKEI